MSASDAALPTRPKKTPWWRGEWGSMAMIIGLMFVARSSFANHYQVPSGSMEPTLMPGDRVAVNMMAYGLRIPFTNVELVDLGEPKPGDVVVFKSPEDGTRLIKRVVAVGGDRVALSDGRLWINDQPLFDARQSDLEHFAGGRDVHLNLDAGGGPDIPTVTIPAGMALVLGDHRGNSHDGRFFGLVPMQSLYGRAEAVYYRSGEGLEWRKL